MARTCRVWASMPMCSLRHGRRRSAPCFFALALAFTQEFDACGVEQPMQPPELGRYATCTFRLRCLLHSVLKSGTDHCSQDKASGLSQDRAKQVLDGQAERDSGIRELRAAPAFAVDSGKS